MPSHALLLVSRAYFSGMSADDYAEITHSSIAKALGDDTIQVISAVVDNVPVAGGAGGTKDYLRKGVSLLLTSEDEGAIINTFEDSVDRAVSLGRAWKSQGNPQNQETIDDGWVPSGDWKELLGGGTSTSPSEITTIVPIRDVKSAIVITTGDFAAIDWPAQMFPRANIYGLTAAITPFLTGLPITLSHNNKVLKSGGIAVGFLRDQTELKIEHPRLKRLGDAVTITK